MMIKTTADRLLHSFGDDGGRWSRMVKLEFGCLEFDVKYLQIPTTKQVENIKHFWTEILHFNGSF